MISVPIGTLVSEFKIISLCKNFPYRASFDTKISFRPLSKSFLACIKLILDPNLTITLLDLEDKMKNILQLYYFLHR